MEHVDLFSGIGGFALAAAWAGFRTVQFVEIDPYCQKVLNKNFPGVPVHDDVTTYSGHSNRGCALVTFGFPCQDISVAGKGAGLSGARSGLFFEALRIVREAQPLFVLAENVPALRTRGIDRVLESLEQENYTVEAFVVGAGNAGAPHIRQRVIVLGSHRNRMWELQRQGQFANIRRRDYHGTQEGPVVTDGALLGRNDAQTPREPERGAWPAGASSGPYMPWGICEPPLPGVVDGVPGSVDRIRGLGNCVVPAQVYPILKAIAEVAA